MNDSRLKIGEIYLTPFEPRGKVKVLRVVDEGFPFFQDVAEVEFMQDHAGYKKGGLGRYLAKELELLEGNYDSKRT